jgi:hypothetical protein
MITLAEAKAIYRTGKGHFFDRETFKLGISYRIRFV